MRVLVTGGSGFIGSHVVDKLRARGHEPVIYDLRPSPWHSNPTHPTPDLPAVDTVLGSITDREALERALHSCDAVAHLAAVADVNDVHAEPEDAERVNARGTVAVLEAARRAGVKRIVYASTIWVYSDCEPEEVDEDTLLPAPSHLYTSTKLAGELYCKAYQELYGLDYTILRFGIPYGPRAREAAVIPAFVNKALAGDPLTLAGDGSQSRKFVYVEDLAEGVASGLDEVAVNRVYNLASDETVTIKQIAETIKELMGDVEIVHTPARPGDFGGKIVSSERAERELGWTAATPFSEGVRRYIDWRHEQAKAAKDDDDASVIPAGEPDAEAKPRQVLIISADIGEGHDLPARAVAREFKDEDPDVQVSIVNGLPAMGPFLTMLLRENSAFLFMHLPWLFDFQYWLFMQFAPTRWLARKLLVFFGRRGLMRLIRAHNPDVIVSTYPGVTAVLGELRRRGRLNVPCYSSITDLAGLQYWAH
ncbi:MAG: NAD-dependent epimerase/dehydratase family protein, partial [Solirubrobacteraceae bacterium]